MKPSLSLLATAGGFAAAVLLSSCNRSAAEPAAEHDEHDHRAHAANPPKQAGGASADDCCEPAVGSKAAGNADDGHDHHAHDAADAPAEAGQCGEHGVAEAECAICRPDDALRLAAGQGMKVRLPHPNSAELLGISVAPAQAAELADGVSCFAELTFDQNRLAQITVPADGIIHRIEADLGEVVQEDQLLASVSSAEITATVAKAVLTHQTLERERKLRVGAVTSEQALQEAEATHRAACQLARTYGFTEARIEELGRTPDEPVYLELRAPFAGEVVARAAVRGARVSSGASLFSVADRSKMWAMLQVPESEIGRLQAGQEVDIQVDALPGRAFQGRLTWVGPGIDPHTRLGQARAEVANADGQLRDRMFGRARIHTRAAATAVVVPAGAVQRVDGRSFVFVHREAGLYEVRAVESGPITDGRIEIRAGLAAAERVATTHTFAIKSAMLMSRLGEGCADD